jgi:hypothetical protein
MTRKKNFNWRGFTSFTVFLSFTVLAVSGVILYVLPHGRVAYWVDFHLFGLDKDNWETLHTMFALLFLIFVLLHIINNWKTLWHYVVSKMKGTLHLKKELALAVCIIAVFIVGSLLFVPPFKTIMKIGERIKKSWVKPSEMNLPFPHAELQPLSKLSKQLKFDLNNAIDTMKSKGLDVQGPGETLKDIAVKNNMKPSQVFSFIQSDIDY